MNSTNFPNSRKLLFAAFLLLLLCAPGLAFAHHCKGAHASDLGCGGGGGGGGGSQDTSISCDELFGFEPGTCTAEGTSDPCEFVKPSNEDGSWQMNQDCDTRDMLEVGADFRFLSGRGHRLNLVAPWSGEYAGISNHQGANRIADIHIRVSDPAVAGGCAVAGKVQAAIFFDPDRGERSGMPRGNLYGITVETQGGARFCNAIEYVGSDPYIGNPYKEVGVKSSHIMANSYAQFGIWMANINLSDLNDQVKNEFARIQDNIVEATDSACATAVLVGPHVERPRIDDNLVYAPSGADCANRTVGIAVLDSGRPYTDPFDSNYDFLAARATGVSGNTVHTGGDGSIGILVDGETDAEMTNSQVTAGAGSDYGVCVETGADFSEVSKRSAFIGFDTGNDIRTLADCGAALP